MTMLGGVLVGLLLLFMVIIGGLFLCFVLGLEIKIELRERK